MKSLRPTLRAFFLLVFGVTASEIFSRWLDTSIIIIFWAVLVGVVYFPLARIRCPHCKKFPFKNTINIGGLPFLCFWPNQKCDHCGHKIII
jgi:hypothetical protein